MKNANLKKIIICSLCFFILFLHLSICFAKTQEEYITDLKNSNKDIRIEAIKILAETGDRTAIEMLTKIALNDDDMEIRNLATKTIDIITKRIMSESIEEIPSSGGFIGFFGAYSDRPLTSYNRDFEYLVETASAEYGMTYTYKKLSNFIWSGKINFGYRMNKNAVILGFEYFPEVSSISTWSTGLDSKSTMSIFSVNLTYKYNLFVALFSPYLGAGVSWFFVSQKFYDPYIQWTAMSNPNLYINNPESNGNGFGMNFIAGVEIFKTKYFSIDCLAGYNLAKVKIILNGDTRDWRLGFRGSDQSWWIDLNSLFLQAGINLYIW